MLAAAGTLIPAIAAAPRQTPRPAQPPVEPSESALTLWYRQPAAQWVEALPVGNGRLGAMVFGGIEHERLQLNEDTLWAGGPYDPSHAAAREALPRVRTLIAAGAFAEAERLIMDQVIARPPREMPYQTVGDVTITMAGGASATDYRRSLDLDTAIARTSFSVGNIRYAREVFASPVDQVVVCRLTASDPGAASAPGRLTATIAMSTPMAASVHAEGDDTLVLAGVNGDAFGIKGALTYQARVRVLVDGGSLLADGTQLRIVGAKSATLLIAAATSFRRYDDVSGDPAAATRQVIAAAATRSLETIRDDHVAEHRRLFRRVTLDLGSTPSASQPTDERIRNFAGGADPQLAALLLPVRPLPADIEFAARHAAGQPAGHLERQHESAVGQQLHHQHQHPDELLAGRGRQPRRLRRAALRDDRGAGRDGRANGADALRCPRVGAASQHRSLAEHRTG